MALNYKFLLESYQKEPEQTDLFVREGFAKKDFKPRDVDLGKLFAECFGWQNFRECRENRKPATEVMKQALLEGAGAISTAAFQTITQQFLYSTVLEAYEAPEFIFQKMIPTRPSKFRQERIPGIAGIGNERQPVGENEPYPLVTVAEEWQDTPLTKKYGFGIEVTREALFFDQTGVLNDRVQKASYWEAYAQELAAIDCIVDRGTGAVSALLGGHRYNYKGNSIASYGNSSGTHDWDNLQASNALVDYTDIENAELLFDAMTDPVNGVITGAFRAAANQIVIPTSLIHTAKQVVHATEIRVHAGGYPTTGNPAERASGNTLENYQIVTSSLFGGRSETATDWYVGNVAKACEWIENWPQEVQQVGSSTRDEVMRDVVMAFAVKRMGAYYVRQPRYLVKNTVA